MTTPANNGPHGGANQPEDDDPFGYLYADGQAAGATPPGQGGGYGYPGPAVGGQPGVQPGVPRTSYNQVRTVGERTYGGQRGAVPQQQPPQAYQAQYQAPEALQAGGYGVPQQPAPQTRQTAPAGGRGRGGGGSSRKGVLIAAVAVVAAVAIGIGAALVFGNKDDDKNKNQASSQSPGPAQPKGNQPSDDTSASPQPSKTPLPKGEAAGAGMALTGGATLQNTVQGAKSSGGQYVGNFNQVGAALTWTLDVPTAGQYKLKISYAVPGKPASTTLTVNGEQQTRPINMNNFSNAKPGEWDKWTYTHSNVDMKKGTNTVKISCETGNQCDIIIDQLWLEPL
ncbi:carbohydrate-binding protein with CBM35 doain [Streptomyces sp. 3211.6]|uniref:CBM35 domain-containing protein n=1 Tax=Streptomyces TaxID=1883 RepID=UPI0009A547A0|nr:MULTISPECIES: CBM35 domain-containing protein [Streptomyces]RKT06026.1 carbohydrate-binding protein with CBM35 doain [Streptomyces sp. 3211.6]RPF46433.1 carbohydrate-binding protein with CBM35 doain [Streptomyces sp. Ag109_G2-6]